MSGLSTIVAATQRVASDWVALGLGDYSGDSDLLAAGAWGFQFCSANAGVNCVYMFVGGGLGVSADASVLPSLPDLIVTPQSGALIQGWRGFCAGDLDGAFGTLIDAGLSVDFGLWSWSPGTLMITATDQSFIQYFAYQAVPGPDSLNVGASIGADWLVGRWMLLALRDTRSQQYWNAITNGPYQLERNVCTRLGP
jgi:hypothetical protein